MKAVSTVLVTAAEGALGRQAILRFARAGLKVAGSVASAATRDELSSYLSKEGVSVPLVPAQLSKEADVRALFDGVAAHLGGCPEAILNAAGGFEMFPVAEATVERVQWLFDANFTSNWLLLKHALPAMVSRGFGRVVLVSAAGTLSPAPAGMGFYLAAKSALNRLIESAAAETADKGVRINGVLPTILDTPRNRADMPRADHSKWVPVPALLDVVAALFSPAFDVVNGAMIRVPGSL